MYFNEEYVQLLKEKYPVGTRIVVDQMGDDPRPIEPGTAGTVREVDDMGTIHCDFDNGRRLGSTAGTIYQTGSRPVPLAASCTDTLIFKVSHIMGENPLRGVLDVGIKLAGAR